ncbi:MAG: tetratricopeptide repeat protein, partial [Pirellulaceae bacterium]
MARLWVFNSRSSSSKAITCRVGWLLLAIALTPGCSSFSRSQALHRQVVEGRRLTQQGVDAMHRRDWQRAEECFAEAKKGCPYDVQNRLHYAEVLWRTGRADEGITEMRGVLELSPEEPAILTRLGRMYFEVGQMTTADSYAKQALAHDPRWSDAWILTGDLVMNHGDLEMAKRSYIRAMSHSGEELPKVQLRLADAYRRLNQPGLALACLSDIDPAPSDIPLQVDVLTQQALAMRDQGRFPEAADRLERVADRGAADPDLLMVWAECELQAGRLARADWALRQCLEREPTHQGGLELAARMPEYQRQMT